MIFRFWEARTARHAALSATFVVFFLSPSVGAAESTKEQVARFEAAGDLNSAKALLSREAQSNDAASQESLAHFLCRHGESACRDSTAKWVSIETDPSRKKLAQRQLLILDYMDGKDTAADLQQYQALGGSDLSSPVSREHAAYSMVTIPGPLASFARMAALSPDLAPEELSGSSAQRCHQRVRSLRQRGPPTNGIPAPRRSLPFAGPRVAADGYQRRQNRHSHLRQ